MALSPRVQEGSSEPGPSKAGKGVDQGGQAGVPQRGLPSSALPVWSGGEAQRGHGPLLTLGWSLSHPAGAQGGQQGTLDSPQWKLLTALTPSLLSPGAQSCGLCGFHPAPFLCIRLSPFILDQKVPQ